MTWVIQVGAAKHVLQTLRKKAGTWMLVEPFANNQLEDNLNPIGRVFYSASSLICVPASLNENGPALGLKLVNREHGSTENGRILKDPLCYSNTIQHGSRGTPLTHRFPSIRREY